MYNYKKIKEHCSKNDAQSCLSGRCMYADICLSVEDMFLELPDEWSSDNMPDKKLLERYLKIYNEK